MEKDINYELLLNQLTSFESIYLRADEEKFDEYKQMAYLFLNHKRKHLLEEDILKNFKEGMTLEKLFSQNPKRFIQGPNIQKAEKMVSTWYDIYGLEYVETGDNFFDYFFTIKLRHLDLLEIDNYLSYHLENSFVNDFTKFHRFLNITVRKYDNTLLNPKIIDTINEWITGSEKEITQKGSDKEEKIKGRIPREAGDHLTVLNLSQTALFIQYLQKARFILKGDNLNDTQAGKAFHILTGYSAHTIRQTLGSKGLVYGFKHEDYKELHQSVSELLSLIEKDLKK